MYFPFRRHESVLYIISSCSVRSRDVVRCSFSLILSQNGVRGIVCGDVVRKDVVCGCKKGWAAGGRPLHVLHVEAKVEAIFARGSHDGRFDVDKKAEQMAAFDCRKVFGFKQIS